MLAACITRQGASHSKTGRPNEDSVCFELLPNGRGIIAAVSDGAGSAHRAKDGSHMAARYAVRRARQAILHQNESPDFAVNAGMLAAREAIRLRAKIVPNALLADYHCTLILVAWVDDQVAAVQVGDGAAIVESNGACKMLTVPQRGEYANETFFITEDHFRQTMFSRDTSGITALTLFTDGLQKYAVDFQNRKANDEFIPQVITILRDAGTSKDLSDVPNQPPTDVEIHGTIANVENGTLDVPKAGHDLFHWLTDQVGHTEDDMSLIVATRLSDG